MYEFKMPALGAEMTSGTLLEWKVKVGDSVEKHQIIAVIDTDKTALDVESFGEGIVEKLITQAGEKIPVGTVMAVIRGKDEKLEATQVSIKSEASATKPSAIKISPLARKLAQQLKIDISKIKGSGPEGAIVENDIRNYAPGKSLKEKSHSESMKKAIGIAMAKSKREIPHYYLSNEIDFTKTLDWLEEYNKKHPITERLLYVAPLIKAVVMALKKFPEFNGFYINNEFQASDSVHIGMAISLRDGGLMAPALLSTDKMNLLEIMQKLTDLVERTRTGKLKNLELSSGTITITNLGEFGVDSVFGIIYPPQVALIGFGKISARKTITVSLSADHRVTNGLSGSRFLTAINTFLQEPDSLWKI